MSTLYYSIPLQYNKTTNKTTTTFSHIKMHQHKTSLTTNIKKQKDNTTIHEQTAPPESIETGNSEMEQAENMVLLESNEEWLKPFTS